MKDVKIAKDCYIPKENVKLYMAYNTNFVKEDVRKKRKEHQVLDFTNGKKIMSVIYLNNGELVLTNTSIATINQRMINEMEEGGESA